MATARSLMALASGWLIAVIVYMLGAVVALLTVCGIPLGSPACEAGPVYLTLNFGFAGAGACSTSSPTWR